MPDVTGLYRRFGVRLPELGDGWASTRCFSGLHRDRNPSARVHLRSGGFRCFGCSSGGGVLDALQLLGVYDREEARRLAVEYGIIEPPRAQHRPRPALPGLHRAATATAPAAETPVTPGALVDYDNLPAGAPVTLERSWVYVDEHNTPVGRVRRLDLADNSKRIFQERPDGNSWTAGLDGAHLPLYRLPLVQERARQGTRILVVEGEKACDALDRIGVFATTNPGGAGKWRHEYTATLAGATVLAISDCDLAGRLHAIQLSDELVRAGARVLAPLDLDPFRNDGYDIVDYLAELADTVHAAAPDLDKPNIRARLHDHLNRLCNQFVVDAGELQRRRELAVHTANPTGSLYIDCEQCGRRRVHRLSHGLAFCPCGAHQVEP